MNGDFVMHNIAQPKGASTLYKWKSVLSIEKGAMALMEQHFPNTVKLPVIGNNDVMDHDQMPCTMTEHNIYFSQLFDAWFPTSNKISNRAEIQRTFLQGGFYRHDFAGKSSSLLALNTMYFMIENQCMLNKTNEQLDWFETQLI